MNNANDITAPESYALYRELGDVDMGARPSMFVRRRAPKAAQLLERCGWDLRVADVNPEQGRARVSLARLSDGLLVTLDVRAGSASVTRETRIVETVAVGRRGDRFRADRIRYTLLGRQRFLVAGARSAMRWLAAYLADNSPNPALARPAVVALLEGAA